MFMKERKSTVHGTQQLTEDEDASNALHVL